MKRGAIPEYDWALVLFVDAETLVARNHIPLFQLSVYIFIFYNKFFIITSIVFLYLSCSCPYIHTILWYNNSLLYIGPTYASCCYYKIVNLGNLDTNTINKRKGDEVVKKFY